MRDARFDTARRATCAVACPLRKATPLVMHAERRAACEAELVNAGAQLSSKTASVQVSRTSSARHANIQEQHPHPPLPPTSTPTHLLVTFVNLLGPLGILTIPLSTFVLLGEFGTERVQ